MKIDDIYNNRDFFIRIGSIYPFEAVLFHQHCKENFDDKSEVYEVKLSDSLAMGLLVIILNKLKGIQSLL